MEVEEQVADLDIKITRLKVEYEQYFMRILKREPLLLRGQADKLIRIIGNEHISNTALKFRYRQLVDKYNAFKQYWTRSLKEIENGTYRRSPEASGLQPAIAQASSAATVELEEPAPERDPAAASTANLIDYNEAYMKKLYRTYISAREKCKESTSGIKYEELSKAVKKQCDMAVKKYGTERLDFKVRIQGGKARILVIPKKGQ